MHYLALPHRRRVQLRRAIDAARDGRRDAQFVVNRAHDVAQYRVTRAKPGRHGEATDAADEQGLRNADVIGQSARAQAAERHHAHKGHGVKTHHAPAFVVLDDGLQNRVARRHLRHAREAHDPQK